MKKKSHTSSILAIFVFIFLAFGSGDSNSSGANRMLAYNYAEKFVKQHLKSPGTAKFPGLFEKDEHITELGNGEYRINSWVDSQNGFGAMIRSRFSCKIIIEGDNIRVENLVIE